MFSFNNKFIGKEGSKRQKKFELLKKPDIVDRIISVNETRHKWYKELENVVDDYDDQMADNQDKVIKEQQQLIEQKEEDLKAFAENSKNMLQRQLENMKTTKKQTEKANNFKIQQNKLIETYIKSFQELYERKPLKDEILSNIEDSVDKEVLNEFLLNYDDDNVV